MACRARTRVARWFPATAGRAPDRCSPVPLNLVFFGPPGAGKGTQADRFAARHRIPKISTGDMLRKAVQDGSPHGQLVRETLQRGALVGDDLMISGRRRAPRAAGHGERVRARRLPAHDPPGGRARHAARGSRRRHRDRAGRPRRRSRAPPCRRGREDDDEFVIRERLAVYARETEPVLEYYRRRGVVTVLDGNRPLDEVTEEIEHGRQDKTSTENRRSEGLCGLCSLLRRMRSLC